MKIGIMTWYTYYNYGSSLQATALFNFLEMKGYNPCLINYSPKGNIKDIEKIDFKNMVNKIEKKLCIKNVMVNNSKFIDFIKNNTRETKKFDSFFDLAKLNHDFDGFICGSDQIWSPLTFDSKYFLDFADSDKIISYAPSIGSSSIKNENIKKEMAELISRFNYLSVREETGKDIIKEICNKNAEVVLDPTLLLTKDDWNNFQDEKIFSEINSNYLLCYFLGNEKSYVSQIEKYAKKNNLQIINLYTKSNSKLNKYNLKEMIGPSEFISLIKNSEIVFTDSFHGTIFSINFNVPFYCFKRFKDNSFNNQNSRVIDILKKLNLLDRLVEYNGKFVEREISFEESNKILHNLRIKSSNFLLSSLESIKSKKFNGEKKIDLKKYCCGCGVCKIICPKKAIDINLSNDGFYKTSVSEDKCVDCKLCKNICPMFNNHSIEFETLKKIYSFKSKDKKVLSESSSGGFGYELAKKLNSEGYYVCGCSYNNKNDGANHIVIEPNKLDELKKLQGSKYIQSYTADAIKEVLELSKNNKIVFFGTPCQVAGLNNLLKLKGTRKNVILVDLICHGVPTKYLWNKYLHSRCKINNDKYIVKFRDKKYGWRDITLSLTSNNINYHKNQDKDDFYCFFENIDCYNNCCFDCPFRTKSSADIRMGDFWGERFKLDKTGVSMIIPVTQSGISLKDSVSNLGIIEEFDIENYWNIQFPYNPQKAIYRDKLINDLKDKQMDLKKIRKKYYKVKEEKKEIKKVIKKIIRK